MANYIFYLSGCGNSLYLARKLAVDLDAELRSIPYYMKHSEEIKADLVGIVTPVYCLGLPPLVERFLKQMRLQGRPYLFCVADMAVTAGGALGQAAQVLGKRRQSLKAGFTVPMPGTSIVFPTPTAKQGKMLAQADEKLKAIVADVKARRENTKKLSGSTFFRLLNTVGWLVLDHVLQVKHRKLDPAKCVGCGICAQVCPLDAVTMLEGKPVFDKQCCSCFACAQWCPQQAISVGFLKPGGSRRYIHPEIKASDLLQHNHH